MGRTAQQIIGLLTENGADDLVAVFSALEDGEALASIGVTDDDQDAVEEAYAYVSVALGLDVISLSESSSQLWASLVDIAHRPGV